MTLTQEKRYIALAEEYAFDEKFLEFMCLAELAYNMHRIDQKVSGAHPLYESPFDMVLYHMKAKQR